MSKGKKDIVICGKNYGDVIIGCNGTIMGRRRRKKSKPFTKAGKCKIVVG